MSTSLQSRANYLATNKKVLLASAINTKDVDTLVEFFVSYLDSRQKGTNTIKSYRPKVRKLLSSEQWQGVKSWLRPTRDDVFNAITPLKNKSASTQSAHFSAYASFFAMLIKAELVDAQPFNSEIRDEALAGDSSDGHKRDAYTTDEVMTLLDAAETVDLKAAIVLAGMVGLRISEVVRLRWRDVDLSRRYVEVLKSKGSEKRSAPIVKSAHELLTQFKGADDQPVVAFVAGFETLSTRSDVLRAALKSTCNTAGIKWRGVHSLRHHAATWWLQNGASLRAVSKSLGHSSTQVTEVYLHSTELNSMLELDL